MEDLNVSELVSDQIERQGDSCIECSDGHVFTFPTETLKRLLKAAQVKGYAIMFVKHGAQS